VKTGRQLEDLGAVGRPLALAIGFLDGVHLGHQAVIRAAREAARGLGGEAWVLTFDPHPAQVLRPEAAPALLTDTPSRLRRIAALDVDGCVLLPFTRELAALEPADFVRDLAARAPTLATVAVGANWRFGRGAAGDVEFLRAAGPRHGFTVCVAAPVRWRGEPVSSTRVREAVASGRFDDAAGMLGRPYSVEGEVVRGRGVGRGLGFATANVRPAKVLLPPPGVFAIRARLGGELLAGAAYLGTRPTFGDAGDPLLEAHLFGVDRDLYGERIEVFFHRHLRGDRRFAGPDALRAQIASDVEAAREALAGS
jgi:riboflavin kinase/FMN adenylyltransferase